MTKVNENGLPYNYIIKEVEDAMGFKLHDWQIDYLLEGKCTPKSIRDERRNGKTTIYIMKIVLTSTAPIRYSDIWQFSDRNSITYSREFFRYEFLKIHELLSKTNLYTVMLIGTKK